MHDVTTYWNWFVFIGRGALVTLQYSVCAVFFGLIIACIITIMNHYHNTTKFFAALYVSIFRGTPLLIQLTFIYYGLPILLNCKFSVMQAGILAFSLNSGAYVSEIIKSGIHAIDQGQFEAAKALGVSNFAMMVHIIMPQALRNIIPSLMNEFISIIKETSILSIIGEEDIMRRANMIVSQQYDYTVPFLIAALYYYCIIGVFNRVASILKKNIS